MSKVTITFNMPEETQECEIALKAGQLYSALCGIDNLVRGVLKHGGQSDRDVLIEIRSEVADALEGLR